jgi:hypothetical protein
MTTIEKGSRTSKISCLSSVNPRPTKIDGERSLFGFDNWVTT